MVKPNFFIVGAPKSGTTAIYDYLKEHPDVFFYMKEVCYFCSDLTMRTPHLTEDVYMGYYKNATTQKIVADGYVFHLVSQESAKEIKKFNPEAKVLIMLRNPVEMLYSLHQNHVFNGDELVEDFEKALHTPLAQRVSPFYRCPLESLDYSIMGKYYEQVLRYKSVFSEDKLHIILFDDFKADTKGEYLELLKFLGLEAFMPGSFAVVNPNKLPRSKTYLKFLLNPPGFIKALGRFLFPHHTMRREWMIDRLWNLNEKRTQRKPLSIETRKQIIAMYKDDIEKLGKLLNRDLSNWLQTENG